MAKKTPAWFNTTLYVVFILYGGYAEAAPASWPLTLPEPMGLVVFLVATMGTFAVRFVEDDRNNRPAPGEITAGFAARLSINMAAHERDFYSLWPSQLARAVNNVDISHLGPKPPKSSHGPEERSYYDGLRNIIDASDATVRRVERVTAEKLDWIKQLVNDYEGVKNFSLAVYRDPSDSEMPYALSICRIDEQYAWIVALAQQDSTGGYRDLMLTGKQATTMIREYFQQRLWARSTLLLDQGVKCTEWETRLKKMLVKK